MGCLTCDMLATRPRASLLQHIIQARPFFGPAEAANLENVASRVVLVRPGTWVKHTRKSCPPLGQGPPRYPASRDSPETTSPKHPKP